MSLLKNLMKNREQALQNQPLAETKAERLEIVINSLIDSLPMPAAILARNYMGSFLLFNDENADKVCNVLDELKNYIAEGSLPNVQEIESGDHAI